MNKKQAAALTKEFIAQAQRHHSPFIYATTEKGRAIVNELKAEGYWISNTKGEYRLRSIDNTVNDFLAAF